MPFINIYCYYEKLRFLKNTYLSSKKLRARSFEKSRDTLCGRYFEYDIINILNSKVSKASTFFMPVLIFFAGARKSYAIVYSKESFKRKFNLDTYYFKYIIF